jgi:inhibitor of KinA sporulation pathway (predicted exonuclease)
LRAVVFDLELVKRFKKGQLSEIIEIGACKVDLTTRTITDQYQQYILPRSGYVAKSTRKFINMEKEDIKRSITFQQGIEEFKEWIGENYYLCSWGKDDKLHLIDQCVRNKIDLTWLKNYNDIQQPIGKILSGENTKNQLGLKNALTLANIEPIGKAHRGIDDAINTAQLLAKYMDKIDLQVNNLSPEEITRHSKKKKKAKKIPHHKESIHNKNIEKT